jgi:hypothetical protein
MRDRNAGGEQGRQGRQRFLRRHRRNAGAAFERLGRGGVAG